MRYGIISFSKYKYPPVLPLLFRKVVSQRTSQIGSNGGYFFESIKNIKYKLKENKMKTNILTILFVMIFLSMTANAQPNRLWTRLYSNGGDNWAGQMTVDNSGNVYVASSSYFTAQNLNIVTIKYNSSGVQQWLQVYDFSGGDDQPSAIALDNSGNVYVAGKSYNSSTGNDYVLLKYNSSGVPQWVRRYNGPSNADDHINAMAIDNSGNVYVTGESVGHGADFCTIKYNSAGDSVWVRRYDGGDNSVPNDEAYSIAVDSSGNVYVMGYTTLYPQQHDIAAIKYNSTGVQQWIRIVGPNQFTSDSPWGTIKVDASGNVYVATDIYTNSTNWDYLTFKLDSNDSLQWMKHYNGGGSNFEDYAENMVLDPSGYVYVTGRSYAATNNYDWATIKYNAATGDSVWVRRYNGTANGQDEPYLISIDSSYNNIYVGGYSFETGQGNNATMIKYSSSGVQQWIVSFDSTNGNGYYTAIALDASNNIYAVASQQVNSSVYSTLTFKYSQLSGIRQISSEVPNTYSLNQNYPNPFNPTTNIHFAITKSSFVKLVVYDVLGKEAATLVNEKLESGSYNADWDASNYPSGVYFYKLEAGSFVDTKKMILIK